MHIPSADRPFQIEPRCTEPYYTKPSRTYWEMRRPFPTKQAQVYRVLLHQTSITYWEMRPYPVQTDHHPLHPLPTNQAQVCRALLHKPVEPIEKYAHIQCRWSPQLNLSVQSPTTPNQWNLMRNAHISSADGPPNQTQVYRALLHQTSTTYWETRRTSTANWAQVYRSLLQQTTRTHWEICTYPVQIDQSQLRPSVQSLPTPNQYNLLRNEEALPH